MTRKQWTLNNRNRALGDGDAVVFLKLGLKNIPEEKIKRRMEG